MLGKEILFIIKYRGGSHWRTLGWLTYFYFALISSTLSSQVIFIYSSENPVPQELADKLSQRTGCKMRHFKEQKQKEVEMLMKEKKLKWEEVAYLGMWIIILPQEPILLIHPKFSV